MVRAADIERENLDACAGGGSRFIGFIDVAFLDCPPFTMFTAGDCSVANQVRREGSFDPGSLRLWCKLSRTATGILDIGAYTGIYSLAAAALRPDLTIHAFEPNPYSMARLRLNRSVNRLWNIEEHLFGVMGNSGHQSLRWLRKQARSLTSSATFCADSRSSDQIETVIAEVGPLNPDIATSLGGNALIKIDVEGAEALTFKGLANILHLLPDFILETFSVAACDRMNALLGPLGYRAYVISEAGGALQPTGEIKPRSAFGADFNQFVSARRPSDGIV
jgi:FkbM family methyltransferase